MEESEVVLRLTHDRSAGTVEAAPAWGRASYRGPPPGLTPEQIEDADRGARALLQVEPGQMVREATKKGYRYAVPPNLI